MSHGVDPGAVFTRYEQNPILTAGCWPVPVNVVFNPSAVRFNDETVLLVRAEDRCGLSSLFVARSPDGLTDWTIDAQPVMSPVQDDLQAAWGFEDPRAVWVDELQTHAVTCTSYGPDGPSVHLSLTPDFEDFEHIGCVMPPEDKNAVLFPRRINGSWVLLHRPVVQSRAPAIWMSRSTDLVGWRTPEHVMSSRPGAWWDAARIGAGPPPIETDRGWLLIYHGVKTTIAGGIYRVGAALLDIDHPERVLGRTTDWLLSPDTVDERVGDVPNVVFPCGAIVEGDRLRLYYGAADTSVCVATASVSAILSVIEPVVG